MQQLVTQCPHGSPSMVITQTRYCTAVAVECAGCYLRSTNVNPPTSTMSGGSVMEMRCSGTLAPAISTSHSASSLQSTKSVSQATPPSRATVPDGRKVLSARCQSREPAGPNFVQIYWNLRQTRTCCAISWERLFSPWSAWRALIFPAHFTA